jgi:hypothetical protein
VKQIYEGWGIRGFAHTLSTPARIAELKARGLLERGDRLIYRIEAHTWEEANAIHSLRQGFGPYVPMGKPARCPRCSAWFYPKGSGQCWRCGKVSTAPTPRGRATKGSRSITPGGRSPGKQPGKHLGRVRGKALSRGTTTRGGRRRRTRS